MLRFPPKIVNKLLRISDVYSKMDTGLPSRKRLRRTTRSCYQCRKRKVKCQLTDENVETCAECLKSGTQCTLRPLHAEPDSESPPQELEVRLERIESLLRKLVQTHEGSQLAAVPDLLWNEFLLHPPVDDGTLPPPPLVDDHGVPMPMPADETDAKQSLVALLPSAQDAVAIVTNTTAWLWGPENPRGSVLTPNDTSQLLEHATISKGSGIHIAKTLLLFALYMQQLPANFDVQFLESQNVEGAIKLIVERVKLFIASHEEEVCSVDGSTARYDSDRALLEQVIDSFDATGKMCRREHVARQISEILSSMLGIVDADSLDALFTASNPPDPDTSFNPGLEIEGTLGTARIGMEDILVSSIRPAIDAQSPAARLIDLCFPLPPLSHNARVFNNGILALTIDGKIRHERTQFITSDGPILAQHDSHPELLSRIIPKTKKASGYSKSAVMLPVCVCVRLQYILRPHGEILHQDALKLRMTRDVGGQIPTNKCNDTGDTWVGQTLNEGFASNHSAGADNEHFHGE
ncbi:hypothetical protein SAPIO_CDS9234 [Scedosporium apiospermum]|uniref:Zn(2)-C6 fungal-type domain-containing protein n=1 Tax=Pseudallescheria apiosperma TaxID=563466 RepID=A0A084FYM0_PSEDA|nr:uncharacterized protein SAPIO_CDS9234 [Scedosporium apiospermum]KEZ40182.1 hypothetical protein SAPIO_CDS9234 [Scedosporium apiospermum]